VREEREARAGKGKERGDTERKHERHERDELDDDDGRSTSQRSQRAPGTSASPAPGAFNGWESATLYYHAIHRLPPLSVSPYRGGDGGTRDFACGKPAARALSRLLCGVAREGQLAVTLRKVTRNVGTKPNPEAELGWSGLSLPRWPDQRPSHWLDLVHPPSMLVLTAVVVLHGSGNGTQVERDLGRVATRE
jgi:hypothetical protein